VSEYKSIDPASSIPAPGQWGGWVLTADNRWLCVIASSDLAEIRFCLRLEANRRHVPYGRRWCLPAGKTPAGRDD